MLPRHTRTEETNSPRTRGREQVSAETVPVTAAAGISPQASLVQIARAASGCRACDLWKHATQTVFGAGSPKAVIMMVGEQPGDQEDRIGRPFVGPAGKLFDQALEEAGIDRSGV